MMLDASCNVEDVELGTVTLVAPATIYNNYDCHIKSPLHGRGRANDTLPGTHMICVHTRAHAHAMCSDTSLAADRR